MNPDRLTMTVEETAVALGISRNLAYEAVRGGRIPAIRIGRRLLVPRRALENVLQDTQSVNCMPAGKPPGKKT